jgi:preprotein translocase subunit SecA
MNKQREAVYSLRRQLMEGVAQKELITEDYVSTILSNFLDEFIPEKALPQAWKIEQLNTAVYEQFGLNLDGNIDYDNATRHDIGETIFDLLKARYDLKEQILGEPNMRYHERVVMLSVLDGLWKEHLLNMDHLKEGIGLRGYAQQDPLVAYKKESYEMFEQMMLRFQEDTCRNLFRMQILGPDSTPIETLEQLNALRSGVIAPPPVPQQRSLLDGATGFSSPSESSEGPGSASGLEGGFSPLSNGQRSGASAPGIPTASPRTTIDKLEREFQRTKERDLAAARNAGGTAVATQRRTANDVGRNDPCPCGSGKKYKKCHGANA